MSGFAEGGFVGKRPSLVIEMLLGEWKLDSMAMADTLAADAEPRSRSKAYTLLMKGPFLHGTNITICADSHLILQQNWRKQQSSTWAETREFLKQSLPEGNDVLNLDEDYLEDTAVMEITMEATIDYTPEVGIKIDDSAFDV